MINIKIRGKHAENLNKALDLLNFKTYTSLIHHLSVHYFMLLKENKQKGVKIKLLEAENQRLKKLKGSFSK